MAKVSEGLKEWLKRNPDAKVVDPDKDENENGNENEETDEKAAGEDVGEVEDDWKAAISASRERLKESTDYTRERLKESTEYTRERLKLATEVADKYTKLAFQNLRRSVLETIMSDPGRNPAVANVRRQAITAVLGEEAWKEAEEQYEITGPAWRDPEAVTRALGALELGDRTRRFTPNHLFDAWRQISPAPHYLEIPQRIDWLEKQGYITDRTALANDETAALAKLVVWIYIGLVVLGVLWLLAGIWKYLGSLWLQLLYPERYAASEETPPKGRKRKTIGCPGKSLITRHMENKADKERGDRFARVDASGMKDYGSQQQEQPQFLEGQKDYQYEGQEAEIYPYDAADDSQKYYPEYDDQEYYDEGWQPDAANNEAPIGNDAGVDYGDQNYAQMENYEDQNFAQEAFIGGVDDDSEATYNPAQETDKNYVDSEPCSDEEKNLPVRRKKATGKKEQQPQRYKSRVPVPSARTASRTVGDGQASTSNVQPQAQKYVTRRTKR